jgi:hypothetical protein
VANPETKKWTYTMTVVNTKVEVDELGPEGVEGGGYSGLTIEPQQNTTRAETSSLLGEERVK